jgi:hypothetical protein
VRFTARSDFSTLGRADPIQDVKHHQQGASEQAADDSSVPDRAPGAGRDGGREDDDFDR